MNEKRGQPLTLATKQKMCDQWGRNGGSEAS